MNYEIKFLEHACSADYNTDHIELLDDKFFHSKTDHHGIISKVLYYFVDINHELYLIKTISSNSGVVKGRLAIIEEDLRTNPSAGNHLEPFFNDLLIAEYLQINCGFSFSTFKVFEIRNLGERISVMHYRENKDDIIESLNLTTLESHYEDNIYVEHLESAERFTDEYVSYFFEKPSELNPGEIGFMETRTIISLGKFDFDLEVFFGETLLRKYRLPKKTGNYHLYLEVDETVFFLKFPLHFTYQQLIDRINDGTIKLGGIILSKEKIKTRLNRTLDLQDSLDEMKELEFSGDDFRRVSNFKIKSTIGEYSFGRPDRVNIVKK